MNELVALGFNLIELRINKLLQQQQQQESVCVMMQLIIFNTWRKKKMVISLPDNNAVDIKDKLCAVI